MYKNNNLHTFLVTVFIEGVALTRGMRTSQ
jgi:hypothetical protein